MTVLVWGAASDPPVELVIGALIERNADLALVDPRQAGEHQVTVNVAADGGFEGTLRLGRRKIPLGSISGAYLRPVEPEFTPIESGTTDQTVEEQQISARFFYEAMADVSELMAATGTWRVFNRLSAMASNMSKPFQAQVIVQNGFSTPETLLTDDPDAVGEFAVRFPDAIYKSASGVRSIVSSLADAAPERLRRIRWCPVQFQERVRGFEVRVHVVGDRTFAVRVRSDALDYRYARAQTGTDAELEIFDLPGEVHDRCVTLAEALDLPLAGVDLKFCDDGRVVCFEVNPSPGFSYYELTTGLPISAAIADELTKSVAFAATDR
jgi:glutathione synthase/RimK-type ligase-like ATP-grasp enzyme